MAIYSVKFADGYETIINAATDERDAKVKAFNKFAEPIYCRIHGEIDLSSSAPIGEMGWFCPASSLPISVHQMREVYMGGGYCLLPAGPLS